MFREIGNLPISFQRSVADNFTGVYVGGRNQQADGVRERAEALFRKHDSYDYKKFGKRAVELVTKKEFRSRLPIDELDPLEVAYSAALRVDKSFSIFTVGYLNLAFCDYLDATVPATPISIVMNRSYDHPAAFILPRPDAQHSAQIVVGNHVNEPEHIKALSKIIDNLG